VIRNIVLLIGIFILFHLANITEALSYITRPMVVIAAGTLGIHTVVQGSDIVLGKLMLPWNQDCSGINGLILLLAITLWANRHERFGFSFFIRLVLCIPAALIANVFRILTLAAYRYVFYPGWEGQQVHYLIGFIWLIPFIVFFVKNFRQKYWLRWLEIFYVALVLAVLAPVVFSPGGSVVAVCSLFYLARNRVPGSNLKKFGSHTFCGEGQPC